MKITIESTSKLVHINGVPARIWEGANEAGTPIHCYVTRIAVSEDAGPEALAAFQAELQEHRAPSPEIAAIPLRMIL